MGLAVVFSQYRPGSSRVTVRTTLGELVLEARPSDRLTDSAVCLVAPERLRFLLGIEQRNEH